MSTDPLTRDSPTRDRRAARRGPTIHCRAKRG